MRAICRKNTTARMRKRVAKIEQNEVKKLRKRYLVAINRLVKQILW